MEAVRTTLLHEVHDGPGAPPATRAAFGEGMSARRVLLELLPLRTALLPLRAVSRAALRLVRDAEPSLRHYCMFLDGSKSGVTAFHNLFPRVRYEVWISGDRGWGADDLPMLSQLNIAKLRVCTTMALDVHQLLIAVQSRCEHIELEGDIPMTEETVAMLHGARAVSLHSLRPGCPLSAVARVRSITSLTVFCFGSGLSHTDFLPLAGQLRELSVVYSEGIQDLSAFTTVDKLAYTGAGLLSASQEYEGSRSAHPLPLSLRELTLQWCAAPPSWSWADCPLSRLARLQALSLFQVTGLSEAILQALPPTVTRLSISCVPWAWLRHLTHVKHLLLTSAPEAEKQHCHEHAGSHLPPTLAGLEALEVDACTMPLEFLPHMPALRLLRVSELPPASASIPWLVHHAPRLQALLLEDDGIGDAAMATCVAMKPGLRCVRGWCSERSMAVLTLRCLFHSLVSLHGAGVRAYMRGPPPAGKTGGRWERTAEDDQDGAWSAFYRLTPARLLTVGTSLLPWDSGFKLDVYWMLPGWDEDGLSVQARGEALGHSVVL